MKIIIYFMLFILLSLALTSAVSEIIIGDYQDYPILDVMIYSVYNVEIDGDLLRLDVGYGGCKDEKDNFNLIWDGKQLESNPPQVNLFLTLRNEAIDSNCDRLWKNTLEFDLKKIDGLEKGSIINLYFDSARNNAPRYKLVYEGKEGFFEECEDIGLRSDGKYCSADKVLVSQKDSEETCNNNFECRSNVCVSNKCINPSLIEKIINWFKKLFRIN